MTPMRLLFIVCAVWVASEIAIGIAKRSKSSEAEPRDRRSLRFLWIACSLAPPIGGFLTAFRFAALPRSCFYPGLFLILAGCVIRWISIATLKKYFTVDVAIAHDHKVIQHGLYSVVRHPSYAGTLMSFFGLGLAFCNWLSLIATTGIVAAGLAYRISVEEDALLSALGDDYRAYAAKTKRLVPGVF